jgi:hypothetical protein
VSAGFEQTGNTFLKGILRSEQLLRGENAKELLFHPEIINWSMNITQLKSGAVCPQ